VVASPSASKQVHHHLEELTMKLYCGIDLHSNNHWLTIIDEQMVVLWSGAYPTICR
jgi:hypothetical protein